MCLSSQPNCTCMHGLGCMTTVSVESKENSFPIFTGIEVEESFCVSDSWNIISLIVEH
jgi:hypothetical protein